MILKQFVIPLIFVFMGRVSALECLPKMRGADDQTTSGVMLDVARHSSSSFASLKVLAIMALGNSGERIYLYGNNDSYFLTKYKSDATRATEFGAQQSHLEIFGFLSVMSGIIDFRDYTFPPYAADVHRRLKYDGKHITLRLLYYKEGAWHKRDHTFTAMGEWKSLHETSGHIDFNCLPK